MILFNVEHYDSDEEAFEHFDSLVGKDCYYWDNTIHFSKLTHYENPSYSCGGSNGLDDSDCWTERDENCWTFHFEDSFAISVFRDPNHGVIAKLPWVFLTREEAELFAKNELIKEIVS